MGPQQVQLFFCHGKAEMIVESYLNNKVYNFVIPFILRRNAYTLYSSSWRKLTEVKSTSSFSHFIPYFAFVSLHALKLDSSAGASYDLILQ